MKRFFIICSVMCCLLCACSRNSALTLEGEPLVALTRQAKTGVITSTEKSDTLFYRFTETQRQQFAQLASSSSGAAIDLLCAKSAKPETESATFYAGFLYESDFSDEFKLMVDLDARPQVSGVLSQMQLPKVHVVLSVAPDAELPIGFFIKGDAGVSLSGVSFTGAEMGFDRRGEIPVFAFGPDGGGIDLNSRSFDFTGGSSLFASENSSAGVLPYIYIEMTPAEDIGTISEQLTVHASYAGQDFSVRRSPECNTLTVQTAAFEKHYGMLSFSSHKESVLCALLLPNDKKLIAPSDGHVLEPLVSDMGFMFEYPVSSWRNRDYELFRWEEFPSVLVFAVKNYAVQDQFFTRLAYFVEKTGYKGTFVDDQFILTEHGYNAHDYKADDLARFFTQAEKKRVRLNEHELLLRDILVHNGVIVSDGAGGFNAGKGCIISFSMESPSYLRYQLIAHEGWHGIYFGDEAFRDTVAMCYLMFDPVYMDFLQTYWETYESLMYDRTDEYLMRNEFMAYHLQQSVSQIADYFLTRARWGSVQRTQKQNADYIIASNAEAFTDTAAMLSDYVFTRWGLCAGRVWNVSR